MLFCLSRGWNTLRTAAVNARWTGSWAACMLKTVKLYSQSPMMCHPYGMNCSCRAVRGQVYCVRSIVWVVKRAAPSCTQAPVRPLPARSWALIIQKRDRQSSPASFSEVDRARSHPILSICSKSSVNNHMQALADGESFQETGPCAASSPHAAAILPSSGALAHLPAA